MPKILMLSTLLILLGISSLLSLAFAAVGLVRKQKFSMAVGLVAFLCFACLFASGSAYGGIKGLGKAYAVARTLPERAWTVTAKIIAKVLVIAWNDDRSHLDENPQVLLLKSYVPETTRATINPQYYTYFGFRDWWRFPLVYPYSIHTIDEIDLGCLYNESSVQDLANDINDSKSLGICGITHLALDQDYLLLRTGGRNPTENSPAQFIIFNFNTRGELAFDSEREMFERAQELGFKSKLELVTLREYNALFSKK